MSSETTQEDAISEAERDRDKSKIQIKTEVTDSPIIGLYVTHDTNADEVAGAILRANRQDFPVVVAHNENPGIEPVSFARQLQVEVVDLAGHSHAENPKDALNELARLSGFPSLIWQADPADRIDFEAITDSIYSFDEYVIDPPTRPDVDSDPHVLVAIPAYNEEATIDTVVREANPYADEVVVIDDGSSDQTSEVAAEAGATVIEHEHNQGYGAALKTAFEEAAKSDSDHLVILDGDGQHDASDIPQLVSEQNSTASEIIIGSRYTSDGSTDAPLYRHFGLFVVNLLTNLSFGVLRPKSWINDTQSGFRAYNKQAIQSLAEDESIGDRMSASTDILYHAHKNDYHVREVGTTIEYELENTSSLNPVSHGVILVSNILKTIEQERPITAMGVPGFVTVFCGLGFGYWTFSNYISTGTFPLGLAIISVFFGLTGLLGCFTAIILHSLQQHLSE
ncbi:Glycosyl transferase family 2 [Halovenus aranensis]|uniref:Glycosyl transferase family 2 n=1 Tax=Halovenus aranensis TaxID=890420 RepID=A0A1G8ZKH6_9EURY|nr:glycosyltransferase family 2 protein [Halovenus aranensis]SDK15632.1 Glycosyl transferase family 2 [Halovenus aranensis]